MSPLVLFAAVEGINILAQVVTIILGFLVALWIIKAFAWGPVIQVLDERRNTIVKEFDTIEKRQSSLDSQIKDYEDRLRKIEDERRDLINKAVEDGRKTQLEIVEQARQEAEELVAKAKSSIQMEVEKARIELRDEMAKISIQATEKLLGEELNDERHKALVSTFIEDLQKVSKN